VPLLASHFLKSCPKDGKSGNHAQKVLKDRICAGIPQLLSSFFAPFPLLPLSVVILSSLLIVFSGNFLHAAFSRRPSHACKRSCVLEIPFLLAISKLPFSSASVAVPSHGARSSPLLILCRCRKFSIARAIDNGPPTGNLHSVWSILHIPFHPIQSLQKSSHLFGPANFILPISRGASPAPGTARKLARADFVVAGNSAEEV
jgi:hypothetical protein